MDSVLSDFDWMSIAAPVSVAFAVTALVCLGLFWQFRRNGWI